VVPKYHCVGGYRAVAISTPLNPPLTASAEMPSSVNQKVTEQSIYVKLINNQ